MVKLICWFLAVTYWHKDFGLVGFMYILLEIKQDVFLTSEKVKVFDILVRTIILLARFLFHTGGKVTVYSHR